MTKKYKVSYDEFHRDCKELACQIAENSIQYDYIVAPSRGGLLPGTIISHILGIPLHPIIWSTRDHEDRVTYCNIQEDLLEGKRVLFIDDINDTGLTIKSFIESMIDGDLTTATVYQRHSTKHKSNYYKTLITDDTWIIFPYEN